MYREYIANLKKRNQAIANLNKKKAKLNLSFNFDSANDDYDVIYETKITQIDVVRHAIAMTNAATKVRIASAIYCEIEKKDYEIAILYNEYEEICAEDPQDADYVDDSQEDTDNEYEEDGIGSDREDDGAVKAQA
ncbi:hypothetical protein LTR12_003995 [Friedmanniomyces endolithicus]|nr:hypothetical protein LTR74_007863 [Friedmanniomyces endolithicus]KAK1821601.1 hypothetical protein LTR12_003995 [Friedmanniomyces endolithicus]